MSFRGLSNQDQDRLWVIYIVTEDRAEFVAKVRNFKAYATLPDDQLHEIWEVLGQFDASYGDLVEEA